MLGCFHRAACCAASTSVKAGPSRSRRRWPARRTPSLSPDALPPLARASSLSRVDRQRTVGACDGCGTGTGLRAGAEDGRGGGSEFL